VDAARRYETPGAGDKELYYWSTASPVSISMLGTQSLSSNFTGLRKKGQVILVHTVGVYTHSKFRECLLLSKEKL
jgi:hypothetical protein